MTPFHWVALSILLVCLILAVMVATTERDDPYEPIEHDDDPVDDVWKDR